MNIKRTTILTAWVLFIIINTSQLSSAQTIVGSWQLLEELTCINDNIQPDTDEEKKLVSEMKSMAGPTAMVVTFKPKGMGEEASRILNRKKTATPRKFLYKFDGDHLLILDKKSQTLSHTYSVDKISTDSLILSNPNRPCEVHIFRKIKEGKAN